MTKQGRLTRSFSALRFPIKIRRMYKLIQNALYLDNGTADVLQDEKGDVAVVVDRFDCPEIYLVYISELFGPEKFAEKSEKIFSNYSDYCKWFNKNVM